MKKKLLAGFALGVFLLSLTSLVGATPYTGSDIELLGNGYTSASNRWSDVGDGAIYTAWANEWVEYETYLTAGNWNIGLNVINHGYLGSGWYTQFRIDNTVGSTITIPASDTEVNNGFININLATDDDYTVRYTWINDSYDPPRDANIQINSVFFDDTSTAPVPEPSTILLMGIGLLGLVGYSRKRSKKS